MAMILTGIANGEMEHKYTKGERYYFYKREPERDSYSGEIVDKDHWNTKNKFGHSEIFAGEKGLSKYFDDLE